MARGSPADALQPGGHLTGFSFLSATPPTVMYGNSQPFPDTPTLTSVIYTGAPFSDAGDAFEVTPLCFLPGTQIRTIRGEVAVELLTIGDLVVTLTGAKRRIRGSVSARCWRLSATQRRNASDRSQECARQQRTQPRPLCDQRPLALFRRCADPSRMPHQSSHHPLGCRAQEVTVYHIELETHDVLLANGAPAESYRDNGNRWLFQNHESCDHRQENRAPPY